MKLALLTIFASIHASVSSVEAFQYHHISSSSFSPPPQSTPKPPSIPGPIVDLGYERHQANFNSTGHYQNFSNIPYATPPLANLRFAKPLPINTSSTSTGTSSSSLINNGSIGHICPQAHPDWTQDAALLVALWTLGLITNVDLTNLTPDPFKEGPRDWESEDCLLLDVVVPEGVIEAVEEDGDFVPLMVWIHGGGFTFGHKNQDGSPYGFFNASTFPQDSVPIHDSIIFVTINYRLGAFGFLSTTPSTPSNPSDSETQPTANAGLYDQALALTWVSEHISKFGGDPDRVTVIGESAGAASILHHITSYGGESSSYSSLNSQSLPRAPFQRAILQSPAFFPAANAKTEKHVYEEFLSIANAHTFSELKTKSSPELIDANKFLVSKSPYAQFTFGPTIDRSFIPKPISILLRDGDFWQDIDGIMVSHNSNEGLLFTDISAVENDDAFAEFIHKSLPGLSGEDVEYVVKELYPLPVEEIGIGIVEKIMRVANATAELGTICNTLFLSEAWGEEGIYKYVFGVDPGVHGQDVGFSFYEPPPSNPTNIYNTGKVLPSTVFIAQTLQSYIIGFVKEGDPNRGGVGGPEFPVYRDGVVVLGAGDDGYGKVGEVRVEVRVERRDKWVDGGTRERCRWWGEARWWDGGVGGERGTVIKEGKNEDEDEEYGEVIPPKIQKEISFKEGNNDPKKGNLKNVEWQAKWMSQNEKADKGQVVTGEIGDDGKDDEVEGKEELR
ncbi:carboxylesterase family protein [Sclerotinia borealis F-4128]|uniref:Carboxylesterase family protein n=1 Tax=Sclerotinia borealis (strain F-4128) TaxID=1432307 RepID=W9CTP1_SCLBF|nr:carboxylesterase family protein [Sclerotinia borealis F-4128]